LAEGKVLVREHFADSMFELTDLWTPTLWVSDYVPFLNTLFLWITRAPVDESSRQRFLKSRARSHRGVIFYVLLFYFFFSFFCFLQISVNADFVGHRQSLNMSDTPQGSESGAGVPGDIRDWAVTAHIEPLDDDAFHFSSRQMGLTDIAHALGADSAAELEVKLNITKEVFFCKCFYKKNCLLLVVSGIPGGVRQTSYTGSTINVTL
jgi:hypothetical protein